MPSITSIVQGAATGAWDLIITSYHMHNLLSKCVRTPDGAGHKTAQ